MLATIFKCGYDLNGKKVSIVTPIKYQESLESHIKRTAEIYSFSDPIDTGMFKVFFAFLNDYKKLQIKIHSGNNISLLYNEGLSFGVRYYTLDTTTSEPKLSDLVVLEPNIKSGIISLSLENEDTPKILRYKTFFLYITLPNGYVFKVYADNINN